MTKDQRIELLKNTIEASKKAVQERVEAHNNNAEYFRKKIVHLGGTVDPPQQRILTINT